MGSSENVQLYLAFLFLDKKKSEPVVCVTVHIHGSFHDESRDQSECTDGLGDCLRDVIGSFPSLRFLGLRDEELLERTYHSTAELRTSHLECDNGGNLLWRRFDVG